MIRQAAALIQAMGAARFLAETLALVVIIVVPWLLLAVFVGEN